MKKSHFKPGKLVASKNHSLEELDSKTRRQLASSRFRVQFNAKIAESIRDYANIEADEARLAANTCKMLLARINE